MFAIMIGWQPITQALGDTPKAWFLVACAMCVFYLGFLCFPLFGVKEDRSIVQSEEKTTLRQMWQAISKNDQLLWTTLAMTLFQVGYCTTTGFAIYYMKYLFGNENMYAVLAAVCGVAQLAALGVFPLFSKRFNRRQLYSGATVLVLAGDLVFFFAEHSLILIAVSAILLFIGQAFIQLLMLMFLADTIEYGQWKLRKRNESVTFSIQPLVNKIGGALSTGIISIALIVSGIKQGEETATSIGPAGQATVKAAMFAIPLGMIVAGFFIYLKKYKIDETFYASILRDLEDRGELKPEVPAGKS